MIVTGYVPLRKLKSPVGRLKRESLGLKVKNAKDDVRAVKYWLMVHGFKLPWDDRTDAKTIKAIETFQGANKKKGDAVDGIVDPGAQTWKRLTKARPKPLCELLDPSVAKDSLPPEDLIRNVKLRRFIKRIPPNKRLKGLDEWIGWIQGHAELTNAVAKAVKDPMDVIAMVRIYKKVKCPSDTYRLLQVIGDSKNKSAPNVIARMAEMDPKRVKMMASVAKKINFGVACGKIYKAMKKWDVATALGIIVKEGVDRITGVSMIPDLIESYLLIYHRKSDKTVVSALRKAVQFLNFSKNCQVLAEFSYAAIKAALIWDSRAFDKITVKLANAGR